MNSPISILTFPDFSGPLWYLDSINTTKVSYLSGLIKNFEWEFLINRIRAPHIVECGESDCQMERTRSGGFVDRFRLVNDLFFDSIEVAAKHVLYSYKQLPYAFSVEDAIYPIDIDRISQQYVWTVAVYGGNIVGLEEFGKTISENFTIRTEKSKHPIKGKDNTLFYPDVLIMDVILIDGGEPKTDILKNTLML